MPNKVKPTPRQTKLAAALLNRTEKESLGEIVKKAGYSENSSLVPKKVIETKGVQTLIEASEQLEMSDTWFAKKIKQGLEDNDPNVIAKFGHLWARLRYSDAFRQKLEYNDNRVVNQFQEMSNDQLKEFLKEE